jgi:hypothetical protein
MLKGKCLSLLFIIVLLTSSLALTNKVTASPATKLYMDPSVVTGAPGEEFEVQIKVEGVTHLYTWYFLLSWNASLLEVPDDPDTVGTVEGLTEGPFLKNVGATSIMSKFYPNDYTLLAMCSLTGVGALDAPSGSGTLAIITFVVKAEGECALVLSETELCYIDPIYLQPVTIDHTVENGYFKSHLPRLSVEPSTIINKTFAPGSSFTINISAVDVGKAEPIQYLYAWQFFLNVTDEMGQPTTILNFTDVTEGPFLNQSGSVLTKFSSEINQVGGYVRANCTLQYPADAVSGNGTLASITFLVVGRGKAILNLDETQLIDNSSVSILHAARDGFFNNAPSDVAVTMVVASPTTVKAGDTVTINVTVRNVGFKNETAIDVSVVTPSPPSPGYKTIGTQSIARLDPDQETSLIFTWDTKGAAGGNYTVRAEASVLGDEVSGNNVKDTYVKVTPAQGLPITWIIAGIIVVVIIAIAVFLYMRRKPAKT